MMPVREGQVLSCSKCSVELTVTKACCCQECEIICCGEPMRVKPEEKKSGCCCCG